MDTEQHEEQTHEQPKPLTVTGWNYRVVEDEQGYFVTDVWYEGDKPLTYGIRHNELEDQHLDGLKARYNRIKEAFEHPVVRRVDGKLQEAE